MLTLIHAHEDLWKISCKELIRFMAVYNMGCVKLKDNQIITGDQCSQLRSMVAGRESSAQRHLHAIDNTGAPL